MKGAKSIASIRSDIIHPVNHTKKHNKRNMSERKTNKAQVCVNIAFGRRYPSITKEQQSKDIQWQASYTKFHKQNCCVLKLQPYKKVLERNKQNIVCLDVAFRSWMIHPGFQKLGHTIKRAGRKVKRLGEQKSRAVGTTPSQASVIHQQILYPRLPCLIKFSFLIYGR